MNIPIIINEPTLINPVSQLCTQNQFEVPLYEELCGEIKEEKKYHRKQWEFIYIIQALKQRNMLRPGMRGLGFGVGNEPLPALFAKYGVEIIATDLGTEDDQHKVWAKSNQHSNKKSDLNLNGVCPDEQFDKLVSFRSVNMREIPSDLKGFDFVWSSCSLEHIGGIDLSQKFIYESVKCLRPGGVAIHTTEFNISSNVFTSKKGFSVIFRKRDILDTAKYLTDQGHKMTLNFTDGTQPLDLHHDTPPYDLNRHLKLKIYYKNKLFKWYFVSTSIGLIIDAK